MIQEDELAYTSFFLLYTFSERDFMEDHEVRQ